MADLRRQGIYQDQHGRYLYYRKKTNSCLVIPYDDLKRWQLLRMRPIIALMLGVLPYRLIPTSIYVAILVAVVAYGLLEYFNYWMTRKYVVMTNHQPADLYDPQKENQEASWKLLLKAGLYLLLAVLLVVSTFTTTNDALNSLLIYGIAVAAAYFSYQSFNLYRNK